MSSKTIKALSLSAVALLVVVVVIIVIRRRGRKANSNGSPMSGGASLSNQVSALLGKKVYVKDEYKNSVIYIWFDDFNSYFYFDKILKYVVIPNNANRIKYQGYDMVEICAVGDSMNGKINRTVLNKKAYIAENMLNL